jgi:hypothetical protein
LSSSRETFYQDRKRPQWLFQSLSINRSWTFDNMYVCILLNLH